MPRLNTPPRPPDIKTHKANNELLQKGVLCVLIGLAVLISPAFLTSPDMRGIVAASALVGWFSLVLGCAFLGLYIRRHLAARKTRP